MKIKSNNLLSISLFVLFFITFQASSQSCDIPDPCDGKTYTQGGWGAGNCNTATQYLTSHFSTSFPSGLSIGCGNKRLVLTSPSAVAAFLPSGSTPSGLPTGTLTDPGSTYNNVLAGQLVALTLNATFDANNPSFSPSAIALSNYTIASGTFSGMTVGSLITLANSIIGGCSTQYSYSQINTAIDNINKNYDGGNTNHGFLVCAGNCNISITTSFSPLSCFGGVTTVSVFASGGTAPYSGTGTYTASAGSHTFQVTDANGCVATKTITISQPSQLMASSSCGTIVCYGSQANVVVTASGGTSPYTGTGTFSKPAGVHSFTVTDKKGCMAVTTRTLVQPPLFTVTATAGTISCYGGSTTVTLTTTGGTPPYDYNNCGTLTRQAGVHSFTVVDSKGCKAVTTITITQPPQLIASNTSGTIACNGAATTITVTASGGTTPYVSGVGTFTALAGVRSFTVTDSKGCKAVTTRTLTQPSKLVASSSSCGAISCYGGTAAVAVTATGGTPPYSGTGNFNKSAGVHTFTVTDSKGCTSVTTETLTQPSAFTITATAGTISCYGGSTTVTITTSGGAPPYNYNNCGSLTRSAGVHTFTVTDSKGCTAVTTITITQPPQLIASNTSGTIACNGAATTITVTASGGTTPYVSGVGTFTALAGVRSFTVTDSKGCKAVTTRTLTQPSKLIASSTSCGAISCYGGAAAVAVTATGGTPPYSGTGNFNKSAGVHTFTVTDSKGCTSVTTETLTQPSAFTITATAGAISCYGGSTTVTITTGGGTPPYNYNSCGSLTRPAGVHSFTVTDSKGCTAVTTITITQPAELIASASSGVISCNQGSTTITVSATGGTPPYVSGTGTFTRSAGVHSFTVTDSKGCKSVVTKTLTQSSTLTASATCNSNIACYGGTTAINIIASGGTAPYTNTGLHVLSAGPYSFTVTDANACSAVVSGTITQPSQLTASATNGTAACGGTSTVSVSASGGMLPYSGTGIYTVNAGPYSYTVTDANGCKAVVCGTITQSAPFTASVICNTNIACYGGTTAISIVTNGGTAPFFNAGTHIVSAGPYSYTVTDSNGCSAVVSGTIAQPSQLSVTASNGTINCFGETTTVNITANGGTVPYSGTGVFTVSAGTYTYLVTDAKGCTATTSITITQPNQLTASVTNGTITVFGGATTVNISANGGTTPYTGTGTFTASAGTHTYLVTDANGCSVTLTVTLTEPVQLLVTSTQGSITCFGGTTTVNIVASGGVAPYTGIGTFTASAGTHTYLVSDANNNTYVATVTITQPSVLSASATKGTITCFGGTTTVNITATGGTAPYTNTGVFTVSAEPYSFTVTDVKGCSAIVTGTITQPSVLSASATNGTINCFGGTTTVNITATGGTVPYTGTGVFTVSAGTYTYLVTDAKGCTTTTSVTITQPSQLTASVTSGTITVFGGTTTVNISASGGTAPYTGTGIFTASAGTHTYLVTDANGCTVTLTITLTEPGQLVVTTTQGSITCFGGTTTVNIVASGGVAPYTGIGTYTASAGTHMYLVSDANNNTYVATVTITQPSVLSASATTGTITCFGGTTTINITATGGTAPYSGTGVQTVSAGPYSFTVTDAKGCSAIVTGTITQPSQLTASVTSGAITVFGGTTTVNISANGGTAPYTGTGFFTASAGTHTYLVTDANGCTVTLTITLTEPGQLVVTTTQGSITCFGGTTTVNIVASGGVAPYTGIGTYTASAGTHMYLVSDANNNTYVATVTITQPSVLSASATTGTITCFGGTTTINITATGGTAPYSGTGVQTVSAGPYSFTVTDAKGCSAIVTGTITQPSQLTASVTSGAITVFGGTTTVNISANGGTAPYTGTGFFTASAGTHTYLVTDANGCTVTLTITLTEPGQLVVTTTQGSITCFGGTTTVNIVASGGVAPYTGIGTYTASAGTHTYLVSDANNNTYVATVTITQPSVLSASATNGTITCFGGTTTVNITATGGTAPYTGTGVQTVSAGSYSFTVTDSKGCSAIVTGTITQPSQLTASLTSGAITVFGGTTTVNISANGGTAPYTGTGIFTAFAGTHTYLVTDANGCTVTLTITLTEPGQLLVTTTQGSITCFGGTTTVNIVASGGVAPYTGIGTFTTSVGTHTYLVSDANNNTYVATVTITQPSQLIASAINGTITCFGGTTTVNITATGGTAPYTNTGVQTVSAGPYSSTVIDAKGCSAIVTGTITQPSVLSASATNGTITCFGGTTTVNITATGGTAPYTNTGVQTVSAGTHTYLVTDAKGCTTTTSVTITQPSQLTASLTSGTITVFGGTTTVNISANGGTTPYTGTGVFTVSAGTHTYLVTDANGCTVTLTITLTEPGQLVVTTTQGSITCFGGTTTVNIVASGGVAPYTGIGTYTASAGTHTYLVSDANNNTYVATVTITQPSVLSASAINGTITCFGGTTTVTITATGGTAPYSGTGVFTVSAGTYTYLVTDAKGCTTTTSIIIAQPSQLTVSVTSGTITVFGGTTTVNISAMGGTAPYTGTGIFTASAGTHTYLVTDANGCTATLTITLTEPGQLVVTTTQGSITCFGGTTTVNIVASGGVAPYTGIGTFTVSAGTHTYLVSDANNNTYVATVTITQPGQLIASVTSGTITVFGGTTTVNISANGGTAPYTGTGIFTASAGTHTYLVTDANGCTETLTITLTEPGQLLVTTTQGSITCFGGTTTVNMVASGGVAPYTGIGTFTASAGTHTYLVSDANNNTYVATVTITQPSQLTASATNGTITCFGVTTTVNITATGGTAPYSGTGVQTVSAGPYSFTVTDAKGCSAIVTGTITQPSQLTASLTSGTITVFGGTTTVNISANGGTAPYTGTGIFTASAGTHTYLVTDANGCTVTLTITLTEPGQLVVTTTQGSITCFGGTTTVNIVASGGVAPYTGIGTFTASAGTHTYLVSDASNNTYVATVTITQPSVLSASATKGTITCFGGTTTVNITATGGTAAYTNTGVQIVSAGPYSFTVTDAKGCSSIVSGTIAQPSVLTASTTTGTITCFGGTTTINITATGGTAPYTGTGVFTVSAGTHTYLVTDAKGCTSTTSVTMAQPSVLVASATNGTITCFGGTTTVNITATGGTAPYANTGVQTVSAGPYSFTVTDLKGCSAIVSGTIAQPGQLTASVTSGTITVFGGTTTVNISANGGTAPYTGTGIFTASAGTHTYLVTDANGCTVTLTITLTEPGQLLVTTTQGSITCFGGTTTVNIVASGGVAPYTGIGTYTASAGTHTYLVSDANNNTYVATVTITQPSQLTASATTGTITCFGGTTTVNISATGGTAPYTGTGVQTVSAGPYSFTVTGVKGCSAIVTGTITQPSQLTASVTSGTITVFGGTTTVNISANGGTAPYTGTGIFTASAGTHTYLVTDANGCTVTLTITLTEPGQLLVTTTQGSITCFGGTTTVNIVASGGVAPYTGIGTYTASAGTHTYLVSDANNNTYVATVTITQPSQLAASATNGTITCFGGTTTVTITATGGTAPYSGTGVFTVSAGTYTYLVTDAKGCTTTTSVTITQPSVLVASATTGTINCFGGTTTVNITATGGTAPYTGTGVFTVSAGTYTYLVTDAKGCTTTTSITIAQPSQLTVSVTSGTITVFGGTTTVNISANGGTAPYTGTGIFTASAGTHTYLVTDANGCTVTLTITLTEPGQLVVTTTQGSITCFGGTTTVNIVASGGVAPYTGIGTFTTSVGTHTYLVSDANNNTYVATVTITQPSQLTASATTGTINCFGGTTTVNITATGGTAPYTNTGVQTVSAGPYSFTVTDAKGCSAIVTGTIAQPVQLIASATNGTINCFGGTTTINITATGGTAPYSGTGVFTVSAGTNTYLVTDAKGCTTTTSVTITQPSQLTASVTSGTISVFGGTTTVNISANGGTAPYTGTGIFTASAGTHTYLVTDANGCTVTLTITLTEPGQLVVTTTQGSITCFGGTTTVNIVASGGVAPYTGIGTFTTSVGTHTYLVSDANNNTYVATVTITQPSQLTASATTGTINCFGGTTTVNITATGGTAPYTNTGVQTVSAGPYSFTVTDVKGCSAIVSGTIAQPSQLTASVTNGTITCFGGTTTVNITATGGTAPYANTGVQTVSAGPYSFTVTDAKGCSAIVSGTIAQPSQLTASLTSGTITVFGGTTTVNISANGGTAPYTGTGIFTASAGTHTYLVTDANGCTVTLTITLTEPGQLLVTTTQGSITCFGGTTTVNIVASGGVAPFTGIGTYTASAGTHTYLVSDANNNTYVATVTITQPSVLSASATTGTITCFGGTTTVNITATGGTAPYTNTGVQTVSAGPYSFTVTDVKGCSAIVTGTITQPSVLSASATNGTINCFGGTTTVNITATGGTAPYTNTGIQTVSAGPYSFTVTDAKGCFAIVTGTIAQPGQLIASATTGTITCFGGTTTVNITATGGTAPYTNTGVQTVSAGPYSFTVTDVKGCSAIVSGTIAQPSQLTASVTNGTITCFGGTTTVNITATGGTAPYTNTGVQTVSAGPYSFTVTDAKGCSAIVSETITQPSQLTASATNGTITCFGGTTTVNITATGGTVPYTGTGVQTVSAGPYSFTVTDVKGCSAIVTGTITQPSVLSATATNGTITCFGGTTTVNITATGGTAPYTNSGVQTVSAGPYSFTVTDSKGCSAIVTGTITQPSQLTASLTSGTITVFGGTTTVNISANGGTAPYTGTGIFTASAGTHTYLVTDANGCTVTLTITLTEPGQLVVTTTQGSITCFGGTTTVNIVASGGVAPYTGIGTFTASAGTHTYLVSDANNNTYVATVTITQPSVLSASATNGTITCFGGTTTVNITATGGTAPYANTGVQTISAGPYSFTVTDVKGCSAIVTGTIAQPSQLTASATNGTITCFGGTTTVNITATGGTAPYTNTGIQTVSAGPYSFTVTDAKGCFAIVTGTIAQPGQLIASATTGTINCFGGTTTVNITATGGTAPYTNTGVQTVSAGSYSFTVTDSKGCSVIVTVTITQPSVLSASATNGTINCFGGTTTVNITATGGTAPYSGTGVQTVSAGSYSFTVTDVKGCSALVSGTITQPSVLSATATNGTINCFGGTTTVNITATGGTAPYTNTGVQTISAGPYSFTVTDVKGCSAIVTGTIAQPSQLTASATNGTITCFGGTTTVNITATGGTAPYTNTGIQTVSAGPYSFTVTDVKGCSAIVTGTITQPSVLSASATNGTINCFGGTTTVNITATGGTAPYTNTGIQTVSAGPYSFTVTDAKGCFAIVTGTIAQPGQLIASATTGTITCFGGTTTVNITATGGTAPYTNTGVQTVSAGPYSFTVTDVKGCSAIVSGTIAQPSQLTASATTGTINCFGGTTTVNITATGGTAPYTNTGVQTVSAGPYSFTVTDVKGCSAIVSGTIAQPLPLSVIVNAGSILCNGGSTNATVVASGGTSPYSGTGVFSFTSGTYTTLVTDAKGCSAFTVQTISEPLPLVINVLTDTIHCFGGIATVSVTASGGTAPYIGIGTFTALAGTYNYNVTDANGCTSNSLITLQEPPVLDQSVVITNNILCHGDSATVIVVASGGTAPYTGEGTFNVGAGTNLFIVSDAMGCSTSTFITFAEPSLLVADFLADSILCNGSLANVTITATGGTSPYAGTGVYTLPPGTHSYVVTDANGCSSEVSRTITEPSPLIASFIADTIRCNGNFTTVRVTAWGGTAPYNGTGTYSVFAGTYTYAVTDTNGCSSSTMLTIPEPPPLLAGSIVNSPILCHGGYAIVTVFATGGSGVYLDSVYSDMPCMNDSLRAMLAANGGTVPYWGPDTYPVPAGSYTYGVVDSHCCWDTAEIVIPEPPELIGVGLIGDPPCLDGYTTVTLTATGGTGLYTGLNVYTVTTGTFTYQIADANGCVDTVSVFVDNAPCVGLEDYSSSSGGPLRVYPNPNNGNFKIAGAGNGKAVILSQSGQLVRNIEFQDNEEVQVNDLAEGMYFLVGARWRVKIVVIRN